MKEQNITGNYENLGNTERFVRFTLSYAAIVVMLESTITGSTMFAVLNIITVAIAMTGIAGWDPLKALTQVMKARFQDMFHTHDQHHGKSA